MKLRHFIFGGQLRVRARSMLDPHPRVDPAPHLAPDLHLCLPGAGGGAPVAGAEARAQVRAQTPASRRRLGEKQRVVAPLAALWHRAVTARSAQSVKVLQTGACREERGALELSQVGPHHCGVPNHSQQCRRAPVWAAEC